MDSRGHDPAQLESIGGSLEHCGDWGIAEFGMQPLSVESMSLRLQRPPEKGPVQIEVSKNLSNWCPPTTHFKHFLWPTAHWWEKRRKDLSLYWKSWNYLLRHHNSGCRGDWGNGLSLGRVARRHAQIEVIIEFRGKRVKMRFGDRTHS